MFSDNGCRCPILENVGPFGERPMPSQERTRAGRRRGSTLLVCVVALAGLIAHGGCSNSPPGTEEKPGHLMAVIIHINGFKKSKSGAT